MELATGAMETLLPKMAELLLGDYKLEKSARRDIKGLLEEMASMEAALFKIAVVQTYELDRQARLWAYEARDLSYVIEDSVDRFMLSSIDNGSGPGLRKKTFALLKKDTPPHGIGVVMKGIKLQMQEVAARRARYRVGDIPYISAITVDPRAGALYADSTNLVGVDEACDEVMHRLLSNQRQLKILSIFGFPGVGKTTVAKSVYDKLREDFDHTAFITVGPNPDLTRVLKDILLQIDRAKYSDVSAATATVDVTNCIDEIRHQLQNRSYFIIVDDIWDTKAWEIIRWALVDCNVGSIAITTTRIYEVAARAGGAYKLEPLSLEHSARLLHMRLFSPEVKYLDGQTPQLIQKILQKCGGVPLAIITIASVLSSKPKEDWYRLFDSIYSWAEDNEAVKQARRIILFSYYDLPISLRACLLHLSIL